jgi:hypothetical protein
VGPSAVVGGIVWVFCVAAAARGHGALFVLEALFLLAPLVLVPLGLRAVEPPARLRALRVLVPMAAVAAAASFFAPRGPWAAGLAALWLALTLLLAGRGLERLRAHGLGDPAQLATDAALLLIPVGGGWLVLSRLGATPMGFPEPIVLLTAVHFHYAAFTTLVLIGLAGRVLPDGPAYRAVVAGALAGTPLLAVGITISRTIELVGATLLCGALWLLALLGLPRVFRMRAPLLARVLVTVSLLSLLPSMALAWLYAWSRLTGTPIVVLGDLALVHAPLNALGFGLCGLLGWPALASPSGAAPVDEDRRRK